MKSLTEYIAFVINEGKESNNRKLITKAAQRIITMLKQEESLEDYVETLNDILKGDKPETNENTDLYLKALAIIFSGKDHNVINAYKKYKCTGEGGISVADLYPTQSEIDIENSAKWATKDWGAKGVEAMFGKEPFGKTFPVPVLVYNDGKKNWIIDGHHRWSQVALINPEAELYCMTIQGKESAQEFLKMVQGVIAGVAALRDGKNAKLPVGKANPKNNIFGNDLKKEKLTDRVLEMLNNNPKIAKILLEILKKHDERVHSIDDIANIVYLNREKMIDRGQEPESWTAPRPVMPQSDQAGRKGSEDAGPDKKGSALNKLKEVDILPDA